jgi:iron(II)-dependent oxidoreductase
MTELYTDPAAMTDAALREHIAGELSRARERSVWLTDAVDDEDLIRQHSPLMSPLVWDFAHIANQEEIWPRPVATSGRFGTRCSRWSAGRR